MCGIAGAFSYGAKGRAIPVNRLLAVRDRMSHRGPDDAGLWKSRDQRVALAHRRLSIIDLSYAASQPMASHDGRYVIVFNGEIYNYLELRYRLESHGYKLRSNSDTEVLLYLYQLDGQDMFRRLRGMYAFALWDSQARELILARDPFGIKPLYVADNGQTLWFSSQVRPLAALIDEVDTSEEPAGHVGYMLWGHVPEPYTLFRGVRSLPGGHFLRFGQDGKRAAGEFWSTRLAFGSRERRASTPPDTSPAAHDSLRALLQQSLNYHLVSDVPVALFLSAGLDSSTLLALASDNGKSSLKTLTVGFSEFAGTPSDEIPLARSTAEAYGAEHNEFRYSIPEVEALVEPFLADMDQPTVDGLNVYLVSRAAKLAGLKVAISGLGGDELFGGYSSFRTIPRLVRSTRLLGLIPGAGAGFRMISAPLIRSIANPKYASMLELGRTPGRAYLLRRGMFLPWELSSILDPDLVRQGMRELQPLLELDSVCAWTGEMREKLIALEMNYYLRNQLLRDTDWTSMASSVEVRTPLVDSVFLEGVINHVNRFGWPSKAMMAETPTRPLSPQLLNRPKTGFSIPAFDPRRRTPIRGEMPQRTWARQVYHTYLLSFQ